MTQEKILSYALIGALTNLKTAEELYNMNPNEKAWEYEKTILNDMQEIQNLLKKTRAKP